MQIAPDGLSTRHLLASGRQLRAGDGRALGAVVVMHDMTGQVDAEEAVREAVVVARTAEVLRRSEARHRLLVRATATMVWTAGPSGLKEEAAPDWESFTGQTWEDYRGEGWLGAVHPDDRAATRAAWQAAIAAGTTYETEHRLRRHDGAYRWMAARAVPLRDAAGAVTEWVGAHTDVHERHEAEATRARQDADFRALADSIPQLVWITDPAGNHDYYNARWYAYTGLTLEETAGEGWNNVLHPDDQERAFGVWRHSLQTGEPYSIEYRFRRHDGAYRWFLGQALAQRDEQGTIVRWFGTCTDIHDQREAEAALASTSERLRFATAAADLGTWAFDPATGVLDFDRRGKAMFGIPPDGVLDYDGLFERIHPDDRDRTRAAFGAALDPHGSRFYDSTYRVVWPDGTTRWVRAVGRAAVREGAAGLETHRFTGTVQDVTDARHAEDALRESESRLRLTLDAAAFGTWHIASDGTRIDTDARFREIWGLDAVEVSLAEAAGRVHEDDRDRVVDAVKAALDPLRPHPYAQEHRVVQPDGSVRWIFGRGRSEVADGPAGPRLVSFNGIISDITERKEAEAALRQSEAQFRDLIDNLPELAWTARADGEIDFYNHRWYTYTGTDFEEMQGWGWEKVHDPDVLPRRRGALATLHRDRRAVRDGVPAARRRRRLPLVSDPGERAARRGRTGHALDRHQRQHRRAAPHGGGAGGGSRRALRGQPLARRPRRRAHGAAPGSLRHARRRAQRHHRPHRRRGQAVPGDRVQRGLCRRVRGRLRPRAGRRNERRGGACLATRRSRPAPTPNWARALAGEAFNEIQEETYPGLGHRAFDLRYSPMVTDDGRVEGAVCVVRDVTAQREAEAELGRYAVEMEERNAELQQFAYVASHDLQEPLRMVTSFLQLLERRYADQVGDTGREYIGYAVGGARRMQALLQDLLAYSRVGTHGRAFETVDLAQVAEDAQTDLTVALVEAGGRVEIGALPQIQGDPVQLHQLLQNLVGNGIKFRAEGRAPVVEVRAERVTEDGQPFWRLAVADNGIGLEQKYADRVFQIFQRLHDREAYEGTGIGLAICKRIAERHGGRIWYDGRPGEGTTFYVTLAA